jgi:HK97 family phage major capsid protein
MNPQLRALLDRRAASLASAKALNDAAAAATRDLTADERTQFDAHMAAVASTDADIARVKALIEAERGAPAIPAGAGARVVENLAEDPRGGFQSFGHFAQDVMQAGLPSGRASERLQRWNAVAPTTYGSEGSGADGGFLVAPEFSRDVFQHSLEGDSLLPLTDDYPVQGNSLTFPKDETTPWGTDGMRAYWASEAAVATQTKPKGSVSTMRLSKLIALVPVTDELAADAGALDRYIGRKTAESIRWKANLAFFQGTGAGQPYGMFGHACQISVAKETGQTADTINATNVAKMYARQLDRRNAIWMVADDAIPQLIVMTIGAQPIWTPPNQGMQNAPNGLLLGRPIMITQLCKTVGDKGDIVFASWKQYRTITKAGAGIETATSMHLYFDADAMAFRATFRVDGQPAMSAAVSPANGSSTLSPFVTLDDRA